MFSKTYKVTLKTIIRSPLTWISVAFLLGVTIYYTFFLHVYKVDLNTMEQIWDTDPRYVLSYEEVIQMLSVARSITVMCYASPLLYVIVSGVVLTRDWNDNLFEIERAGNVRPLTYFFGRYAAVVTFVTSIFLVDVLLAFHGYYFSRRGIPGLPLWDYIVDFDFRRLRLFFIAVVPGILIFVGIAFFAGNLTKSGITGTIVSISYILFEYVCNSFLTFKMSYVYKSFLTPTPVNLFLYWRYYDTEWFDIRWPYNPFTTGYMVLCVGILVFAAVLFAALSYVCVRRRRI